ncbi:MAG: maleylpyruvate isomerase family mycothiol-dependent enzyme [Acidimicrobiales bacterium]
MEIATHIDALRREGRLLADAAERNGPDAPLTTCPEWRERDLVRHTGNVHRWAATLVEQGAPAPVARSLAEPEDDELMGWFRDGTGHLVAILGAADPAVSCWTFLHAPSPLAFWARRQAHETAIHRADAESAGGHITGFEARFAADGIDELVMGFAPTPRATVRAEARRAMVVSTTDTEDSWVIGLGPEGIDARRGGGPHDCSVLGPASDVYLLLWNRIDLESSAVEATGERDLVALWRDSLRV